MIGEHTTFRAVAQTVVAESTQLSAAEWRAFALVIDHALARRPARMRRQLLLFLRLLNLLSWVTHGVPLTRLSPHKRHVLLKRIEAAPLLLLRRGFWGLRTLILMGYYARPEVASMLGYTASPRGWETRV
jgi:hypothetical protein